MKTNTWSKRGIVRSVQDRNRSYQIETETGEIRRRNRRHLRPVPRQQQAESIPLPTQDDFELDDTAEATEQPASEESSTTSSTRTRSGRVIKPPDRLNLDKLAAQRGKSLEALDVFIKESNDPAAAVGVSATVDDEATSSSDNDEAASSSDDVAKASDILKTYIHSIEYQFRSHKRFSEQRGLKHTEGSLMIFDMENLGVHHLWKPAIDMFIKTAVIAEQHYPELIYRLFIIRAPKIFPVTYSLVKPFLREDTRKKIQVLGSNWKEVLLKQIDPDQLPVYWGGTKTDPDGNEMCTSLIRVGGKIPKSFYLKDREPPHTLTTHEVSRGGVIEFKYEVKNANSVMRYEFPDDCSDIKIRFDLSGPKGKKTAI
eukprot:XP_011664910.1 PREDICTED: SEC14-like protein 2 [Strongylocentrotus purpuratus]